MFKSFMIMATMLAVAATVSCSKTSPERVAPPATAPDVTGAKHLKGTGVSGTVIDAKTGKPIAGALLRVAVPSADMRMVRTRGKRSGLHETRTDVEGRFQIDLPAGTQSLSLDAFAPGYGSAAGTLRGGGGDPLFFAGLFPFPPGRTGPLTLRLTPALFVSGIVVDETGKPFQGAQIQATISEPRAYSYLANAESGPDGRFEIFDFPLPDKTRPEEKGELVISSRDKVREVIGNVYALKPEQLRSLRVTLRAGRTITGQLLDAQGRPVARTLVEAIPTEKLDRKEKVTDAGGRFQLHGLPEGPLTLRAHAYELKQKGQLTLTLMDQDADATLRLEPAVLQSPPQAITLLGMTVADVTPELQNLYDLYKPEGVVILNPGPNCQRLGIGNLQEGCRFWMVGNKRIANVREMVAELLRINAIVPPTRGGAITEGHRGMIRVVFDDNRGRGTCTQYLKTTDRDSKELAQLAEAVHVLPASQPATAPSVP